MFDFDNVQQGFQYFTILVGLVCLLESFYIYIDRDFLNQTNRYRNAILAITSLMMIFNIYAPFAALIYWHFFATFFNDNPHAFDVGERLLNYFLLLIGFSYLDARLIQYSPHLVAAYLSILYLSTATSKLYDPKWRNGTAFAQTLQNGMLKRLPFPKFVPIKPVAWFVILAQFVFPFLVWIPALNPFIIATLFIKHTGMEIHLNILGFPQVIMAGLFLCLYL